MSQMIPQNNLVARFKRTFIGDRAFYKTVISLIIPIIIQYTITNFVNLLDNIMVGQVGTAQMSGVAIVNQLLFVVNLTFFGGLAGPGIYGAQFYGAGDNEGLRNTFRYKLWAIVIILASAIIIFLTNGDTLISLYLTGEGNPSDVPLMLGYGRSYLNIMLWGLLPFALTQAYSSTLRETGETMLPMKASIAAVFTNLILNYILIFGKLGFPALGVTGAAIATVISRYTEMAIVMVYTHRHKAHFPFMINIYQTIKVPTKLAIKIFRRGMPLLVNEMLWSLSVTTIMQIFSTRGLNIVAGLNISNTITNLFNVAFISMGSAVAVMVGQALGAGEIQKAKAHVWKLIFFSVSTCVVLGGILIAIAPVIPRIYNTTEEVRHLATHFIQAGAIFMGFFATSHCCYFAMRSGGKTLMTFFFDSIYAWLVYIPFAYVLTHYTKLDIFTLHIVCHIPDALKSVMGVLIIRTGRWAQNIVAGK
jgi:putative MATE family efflux protein